MVSYYDPSNFLSFVGTYLLGFCSLNTPTRSIITPSSVNRNLLSARCILYDESRLPISIINHIWQRRVCRVYTSYPACSRDISSLSTMNGLRGWLGSKNSSANASSKSLRSLESLGPEHEERELADAMASAMAVMEDDVETSLANLEKGSSSFHVVSRATKRSPNLLRLPLRLFPTARLCPYFPCAAALNNHEANLRTL